MPLPRTINKIKDNAFGLAASRGLYWLATAIRPYWKACSSLDTYTHTHKCRCIPPAFHFGKLPPPAHLRCKRAREGEENTSKTTLNQVHSFLHLQQMTDKSWEESKTLRQGVQASGIVNNCSETSYLNIKRNSLIYTYQNKKQATSPPPCSKWISIKGRHCRPALAAGRQPQPGQPWWRCSFFTLTPLQAPQGSLTCKVIRILSTIMQ